MESEEQKTRKPESDETKTKVSPSPDNPPKIDIMLTISVSGSSPQSEEAVNAYAEMISAVERQRQEYPMTDAKINWFAGMTGGGSV